MMPCDRDHCPRDSPDFSYDERPSVGPPKGCGQGLPTWAPQPCSPGHAGPSGSPPKSCRSGLSKGVGRGGTQPAANRSPLVRGLGGEPAAHGCHGSRGSAEGEGVWLSQLWEEPGKTGCGEGCSGAGVASTETSPGKMTRPETRCRACCTCHILTGRVRRPIARLLGPRTRPR